MSRVRVATYNLYLGADLSMLFGNVSAEQLGGRLTEVRRQLEATTFRSRAGAVARLLVREEVDLVGLQEVCTWHAGDRLLADFTAELLAALEDLGTPYDVVVSQLTFHGTGELPVDGRMVTMHLEGRNEILRRRGSPVHVEATECGMFGSALQVQLMGTLDVAIDRGWCAARCSVGDPATGFTFVNTHTEAYDPGPRNSQRAELVDALPGDALVVVGDFNATPDQVGMPPDFRDAWLEAGNPTDGPSGATCCQDGDLGNGQSRLTERIDYVWVRDVAVETCVRVGDDPDDRTEQGRWPSDHAALVATLLVG